MYLADPEVDRALRKEMREGARILRNPSLNIVLDALGRAGQIPEGEEVEFEVGAPSVSYAIPHPMPRMTLERLGML